jgi:membrane-associated phospholipid phosphatase
MSVRAITLLFLAVTAVRSGAQTTRSPLDSSTDVSASRSDASTHPAFGRNTTRMMTGALGAGVAVSLFDSRLLDDALRLGHQTEMDRGSVFGNAIGGPGPIALGVALYAAGRGTGSRFTTNTGREVIRAVLVSGSLTALMKGMVGRSRPNASPGDADEYRPGHGFLDNTRASFPSGHTSAAFAAATVLVRELHVTHPRARWLVDPLLLGSAAFVGFSRVYDKQHWPSDVVVGAALGAVSGYEVVAHTRGNRSHFSAAFLSHLLVAPRDHGIEFGVSIR